MLKNFWLSFVKLVARKSGLRQERAHHFYAGLLTPAALVIDLGAHKGEFSRFIAAEYGCTVLGLEANPQLFNALPKLPKTSFLNLAVHNQDAPVTFHVSENPEASSVFEAVAQAMGDLEKVSVRGIKLDTLFKENQIELVDLLKVDIESAEFPMFESASDECLRKITQITVEFHISKSVSDYTPARFWTIARRLKNLGFRAFVMDRDYTDVLFLNMRRIQPRLSERIAMAMHHWVVAPVRHLLHGGKY